MKRHVKRMHSYGVTAVPKIREAPPAAPDISRQHLELLHNTKTLLEKQKYLQMQLEIMTTKDLMAVFGGA